MRTFGSGGRRPFRPKPNGRKTLRRRPQIAVLPVVLENSQLLAAGCNVSQRGGPCRTTLGRVASLGLGWRCGPRLAVGRTGAKVGEHGHAIGQVSFVKATNVLFTAREVRRT